MKGRSGILTFYIFTLVVAIVLLRPTIIFGAHFLQSVNYKSEVGTVRVAKTIKKRNDGLGMDNILCEEVQDVRIAKYINFWFKANKKHLRLISFLLSGLLSLFIFRIRKKSTVFHIVPDNHHYLALSAIRI